MTISVLNISLGRAKRRPFSLTVTGETRRDERKKAAAERAPAFNSVSPGDPGRSQMRDGAPESTLIS
jgi:hypothetical protein